VVLLLVNAVTPTGNAEEIATDAPAQQTISQTRAEPAVSAADLASKVDEAYAELSRVLEVVRANDSMLLGIPESRQRLGADLDARLGALGPGEINALSASDAETTLTTLFRMSAQLKEWRLQLRERVEQLEIERQRLRDAEQFLRSANVVSGDEEPPTALLRRVENVLEQLHATVLVVGARISVLLDELGQISEHELDIARTEGLVRTAMLKEAGSLFDWDMPPLWTSFRVDDDYIGNVGAVLNNRTESVVEYAKARRVEVTFFLLVLCLLMVAAFFWWVRKPRVAEGYWTPEERDKLVTERPFSIVFLLWAVVGTELFLEPVPVALGVLRVVIVAAALMRLTQLVLGKRVQRVANFLLVLGVAATLSDFLPSDSLAYRLALLLIAAGGAYFFVQLGKLLPRSGADRQRVWLAFGRLVSAVAPYVLAIASVALIAGVSELGVQLTRSMPLLLMALLGVLIVETLLGDVAEGMLAFGCRVGVRTFQISPERIRERLFFLIRLAMFVLMGSLLVDIFPIVDRSWSWISEWIARERHIGTAQFSLSDILVMVVCFTLVLLLARAVRSFLGEDIFPRLAFAPGASEAASRLIFYAMVMSGILFALAAAGVQLGKLTLIVSALGVGIGFGLQGIVNNFVSGLILSFERPINVGDTIVVAELTGKVTRIGLRATSIRTFDGAEVIVPNADLISNNVLNWTLSDVSRRIDIPVHVASGSDLNEARSLLLQVAANENEVARSPEPEVLFNSYRENDVELVLRLWLIDSGRFPKTRSALYFAIESSLRKAGIELPVPQREISIHADPDSRVEAVGRMIKDPG
jgi:small-conductance mechanosensitive channel